jgi:hypothetical protein
MTTYNNFNLPALACFVNNYFITLWDLSYGDTNNNGL